MILSEYGREYAHWPYTADAAMTSIDVNIDGTWYAGTVYDTYPSPGSEVRLLVAGPLATSNPGGTVVLSKGGHPTLLRFNDTPELVVRGGGTITVG